MSFHHSLLKHADTNEELARDEAGVDTPSSEYQYVNPFANNRNEENHVAIDPNEKISAIKQHNEPRDLPPRVENRKHYDDEATAEIQKEKEARRKRAIDYTQMCKELNPTEAKLLKLVQRKSGQDMMQSIYPFSGMSNPNMFVRALNNLVRKGLFDIKDNKPVKTDVTDRVVMTYDALRNGAVVAKRTFRSSLLFRD
jgi:hypothetical protein